MTVNDYKLKHSVALKNFLSTDAGIELILVLRQLKPKFITNKTPHEHTESAGAVRGHENYELGLIYLSQLPIVKEEIEMTYGVEPIKPKE